MCCHVLNMSMLTVLVTLSKNRARFNGTLKTKAKLVKGHAQPVASQIAHPTSATSKDAPNLVFKALAIDTRVPVAASKIVINPQKPIPAFNPLTNASTSFILNIMPVKKTVKTMNVTGPSD